MKSIYAGMPHWLLHVIFEHLDYPDTTIHFETRFVGPLTVTRSGEWLTLDFPTEYRIGYTAAFTIGNAGYHGIQRSPRGT